MADPWGSDADEVYASGGPSSDPTSAVAINVDAPKGRGEGSPTRQASGDKGVAYDPNVTQVVMPPGYKKPLCLCCPCCSLCRKRFGRAKGPEKPKTSDVLQNLQKIEKKMKTHEKVAGRWPWVEHIYVNIFFGGLIMLNSACIGIDILTQQEDGSSHIVMVVLESFFLAAFLVELVLRIGNRGCKFFCLDFWGPFDFSVTMMGAVDAWVLTPFMGSNPAMSGVSALRTLRLLRLFRLIRVFKAFKELGRLVKVLVGAFQSLAWVTLLLAAALYVSSIIVRMLLGGHEDESVELQELCQSLASTMFLHAMLLTAEGHLDVLVLPTAEISIWWYAYWIPLIVFLNFFMVNLMVGLIVQKTMGNSKDDDTAMVDFVHESFQFKRTLLQLFSTGDIDEHGQISVDELVKLMENPTMNHILSTFGIKTDLPRDFLLTILGFNNEDKYISFTRFYESCVRMCGASRDIRAFMLQYDISRFRQETGSMVQKLGQAVGYKEPEPRKVIDLFTGELAPLKVESQGGRSNSKNNKPAAKTATWADKNKMSCWSKNGDAGFNESFCKLAFRARKKLNALERRQEEMLLSLAELRVAAFGVTHWSIVRCGQGHAFMPLGTTSEPIGTAEYRHWTCDSVHHADGCRHGDPPGSHLTKLRRYHCEKCREDLCEDCYNGRMSDIGVGQLSQRPPAATLNANLSVSPKKPDVAREAISSGGGFMISELRVEEDKIDTVPDTWGMTDSPSPIDPN